MLYLPEKNVFYNFVASESLSADLNQIYSDFVNLNYFAEYGTYCIVMAVILGHILSNNGYRARIQSCYAKFEVGEIDFLLGYKNISGPGQIDGHAVCVIDDKYLIDFGLGNARKSFSPQVPWAIACPLQETPDCIAQAKTQDGLLVSWRTDWSSPAVIQEALRLNPFLMTFLKKYYALQAQRREAAMFSKKIA